MLRNMAKVCLLILISSFTLALSLSSESRATYNLQTYIVYVKEPCDKEAATSGLESYYLSFLPDSIDRSYRQSRIVHSYSHVVTGFAARLTKEEAKEMEKKEGFVSARPEKTFSVQTTRTPRFLGLHENEGFWQSSGYGKGVIIGLLDTGILPTHASFNDNGMSPPPAKWKGKCDFKGPACNNKLIGARTFLGGSNGTTPEDLDGHGTHTASTAAGNFVKGANVVGFAAGKAVGMAPLAHVAMYRVCYREFCSGSDILAGFDAAIEDGVDIVSISLGGFSRPFYETPIAIGAFAAIKRKIFVSCSAGNSGPSDYSLSNDAPWILTVGASTVDRSIMATARLGNGAKLKGESLFQPKDFNSTFLPLVYAGMNGGPASAECDKGSLGDVDVKGKIVVCEGDLWDNANLEKGQVVKDAGGAAMILINVEETGYITSPLLHVLPATSIPYPAGHKIKKYINSTSNPTAAIEFKGTVLGIKTAPTVADFSSRGPSMESPGILKPDIIGPGVNILAAFPTPIENTTEPNMSFNFLSGTSMSCPHLSGIAALLKSSHPDWSPAAIKSAIITSADTHNLGGSLINDHLLHPADIFATGAGHVNPSAANDPGLVYDLKPDDYIPYLCGLEYEDDEVSVIAQQEVNCSKESVIPEAQLNYPSFSVALGSASLIYTRTVTNVGPANSSYRFNITAPEGVNVTVKPAQLNFSKKHQKLTYWVTFTAMSSGKINSEFAQGDLALVSNKHVVRSPIAILFE